MICFLCWAAYPAFSNGASVLNIHDFKVWLSDNEVLLQERVASWIPSELSAEDRAILLAELKDDCIRAIEAATKLVPKEEAQPQPDEERRVLGRCA
jgi:hypothetical protein